MVTARSGAGRTEGTNPPDGKSADIQDSCKVPGVLQANGNREAATGSPPETRQVWGVRWSERINEGGSDLRIYPTISHLFLHCKNLLSLAISIISELTSLILIDLINTRTPVSWRHSHAQVSPRGGSTDSRNRRTPTEYQCFSDTSRKLAY